jgi:hypothetical protein
MSQELTYENYTEKSFYIKGDKEKYGKIIRDIGGKWQPKLKIGLGWTIAKEKEPQLKKLIDEVKSGSKVTTNTEQLINNSTLTTPLPPSESFIEKRNKIKKKIMEKNSKVENDTEVTNEQMQKLLAIQSTAKPHKTQLKYHRATSTDKLPIIENSSSEDEKPRKDKKDKKHKHTDHEDKPRKKDKKEKRKQREERKIQHQDSESESEDSDIQFYRNLSKNHNDYKSLYKEDEKSDFSSEDNSSSENNSSSSVDSSTDEESPEKTDRSKDFKKMMEKMNDMQKKVSQLEIKNKIKK